MRLDDGLKKVALGEDYLTVVFRSFKPLDPPFSPPPPIIEKFTPLFVNRRIKAARFAASTEPRERSAWCDKKRGTSLGKSTRTLSGDIDHCGIGELLASSKGGRSVFDVDYWMPFPKRWGRKSGLRYDANEVDFLDKEESIGLVLIPENMTDPGQSKKVDLKERKEIRYQAIDQTINEPDKEMDSSFFSQLKSSLQSEFGTKSKVLEEPLPQSGACDDVVINGNQTNGFNPIASKVINGSEQKPKRMSDKDIDDRIKQFNMEIDPTSHPEQSSDGTTPLFYLKQLEQADMIDVEWRYSKPSFTDFASISPDEFECVELVVRKGDAPINSTFTRELVFQRECEVTRGGKQQVKQYLASLALTRLLARKDKNWFKMTFSELKTMLIPDYEIIQKPQPSEEELTQRMTDFNLESSVSAESSISHQSALEYLTKLHIDTLIVATFKFIHPSPTEFASVAPGDFELVQLVVTMAEKNLAHPFVGELVLERDRLIGKDQKLVKQFLAASALSRLVDHDEVPWTEFKYKEFKVRLQAPMKITSELT